MSLQSVQHVADTCVNNTVDVVWSQVPPKQKSHLVPNSCCYSGFQPLTGFAFRVHAHALGRCARPLPVQPSIDFNQLPQSGHNEHGLECAL